MTRRTRLTGFVLDLITAILIGLFVGMVMPGCAADRYTDPGPLAIDAGDATALLIGCGETRARGSLYCRWPVGWQPTGALFVVVPPVECAVESCATVTVYSPDGSIAVAKTVPRGQSYVAVPWAALFGQEPLRASQRGFWPVVITWSWADPQTGVTMAAAAEGEVRLRAYSATYTPLNFDPANQTWTWKLGGKSYSATDKGRTAVQP